jgi:AraC family transcriptional regulator, regulatory protein of adaptative response / methylated-DNA-[protein]-cysteine methyltransferase
MSGYERMDRIIRWLDEHYAAQPTLAQLAALAGLSEFHFHREFVRWTGVTPKDFVQCLTLAHARARLGAGDAVLEASLDAGLSGPGRLHDLCVTLEAATPGEIKSGGEGMEIVWGMAESPFGLCLVGETARGLCHLTFSENYDSVSAIRIAWPRARLIRDDEVAAEKIDLVFHPVASVSAGTGVRALVRGTSFQLRVWRALLEIPAGSLTTYGRLAEKIGHPGAARAVGTAVGANTLACLIPCHRVIRETGVISAYRWGAGRKRTLIAWEGASAQARDVS